MRTSAGNRLIYSFGTRIRHVLLSAAYLAGTAPLPAVTNLPQNGSLGLAVEADGTAGTKRVYFGGPSTQTRRFVSFFADGTVRTTVGGIVFPATAVFYFARGLRVLLRPQFQAGVHANYYRAGTRWIQFDDSAIAANTEIRPTFVGNTIFDSNTGREIKLRLTTAPTMRLEPQAKAPGRYAQAFASGSGYIGTRGGSVRYFELGADDLVTTVHVDREVVEEYPRLSGTVDDRAGYRNAEPDRVPVSDRLAVGTETTAVPRDEQRIRLSDAVYDPEFFSAAAAETVNLGDSAAHRYGAVERFSDGTGLQYRETVEFNSNAIGAFDIAPVFVGGVLRGFLSTSSDFQVRWLDTSLRPSAVSGGPADTRWIWFDSSRNKAWFGRRENIFRAPFDPATRTFGAVDLHLTSGRWIRSLFTRTSGGTERMYLAASRLVGPVPVPADGTRLALDQLSGNNRGTITETVPVGPYTAYMNAGRNQIEFYDSDDSITAGRPFRTMPRRGTTSQLYFLQGSATSGTLYQLSATNPIFATVLDWSAVYRDSLSGSHGLAEPVPRESVPVSGVPGSKIEISEALEERPQFIDNVEESISIPGGSEEIVTIQEEDEVSSVHGAGERLAERVRISDALRGLHGLVEGFREQVAYVADRIGSVFSLGSAASEIVGIVDRINDFVKKRERALRIKVAPVPLKMDLSRKTIRIRLFAPGRRE